MAITYPQACADCVAVHGDDPAEWLNRWPQGAEWRPAWGMCLCDGCADDRADQPEELGDCPEGWGWE